MNHSSSCEPLCKQGFKCDPVKFVCQNMQSKPAAEPDHSHNPYIASSDDTTAGNGGSLDFQDPKTVCIMVAIIVLLLLSLVIFFLIVKFRRERRKHRRRLAATIAAAAFNSSRRRPSHESVLTLPPYGPFEYAPKYVEYIHQVCQQQLHHSKPCHHHQHPAAPVIGTDSLVISPFTASSEDDHHSTIIIQQTPPPPPPPPPPPLAIAVPEPPPSYELSYKTSVEPGSPISRLYGAFEPPENILGGT